MKDRPILFSAPMVRALLDGSKTQTRRVAKLTDAAHVKEVGGHRRWHPADPNAVLACPYGQPGDQLWVRETWAQLNAHELDVKPLSDPEFVYFAQPKWDKAVAYLCVDGVVRWALPKRWKPSIHMPRAASRITLEITAVRVERLQDITEADAIAEGCAPHTYGGITALDNYASLWTQINGADSFAANPWVWVVEFKRVPQ